MHRTRVRRRRSLGLVGLAVVIAVMTGPVAHAFSGPERPALQHYVVQPGDSLWGIAQAVSPHGDPRAVVDQIRRANDLAEGSIVPGERLLVPSGA